MIGGNKELNHYLLSAAGTSRKALNIMALIGVFIFGVLIFVVLEELGKKALGWAYMVALVVIIVVVYNGILPWEFGLLAPVVYVSAWVHANLILSRYQSAARKRIAELEGRADQNLDTLLETLFLRLKVLGGPPVSPQVLSDALRLPGGDTRLLCMAATVMAAHQRHREAVEYFDRAAANARDQAQTQYAAKLRAFARKTFKLP